MTTKLMPVMLCALALAQIAFADDLLPTPPGSNPPAATPSPATPPAASSPTPPGTGTAPSQQAVAAARAACDTDIQKLCPTVQPGGGRILACLKQHKDEVSDGCKQAVVRAMRGSN